MSRRAATTITSICGAAPSVAGDAADDPVVEDRLVERHRDLLLGLEAHGGLELLGVVDRRQPQGPHDDPLVGDPSRTRCESLCSEKSERSASATASGSATSPSWKASGGSGAIAVAAELGTPFAAHLGRGDAAGLDLEADERARPSSSVESAMHRKLRDRARAPSQIGQATEFACTESEASDRLFDRLAPDHPGRLVRVDEVGGSR